MNVPGRSELRQAAEKAVRRTKDAVGSAAAAARTGAAVMEQKAEELRAQAKLRQTIRKLEKEISLHLQTIGEMVYATHCGDPTDSEDIQALLERVDDLRERLEICREALRETAVEIQVHCAGGWRTRQP